MAFSDVVAYAKLLAMSALAVLTPIKTVMIAVGFAIFVDLITGLWAAHKRGEKITSAGLQRTAIKAFVYETLVVMGYVVETYLTGAAVPVSKIASGFVGLIEMKSVTENLNDITGTDLLKALISKFASANDKTPGA